MGIHNIYQRRLYALLLLAEAFINEKFTPKQKLKIKEFHVNHWEVNWNELGIRATGPVFEVGGHKW